jgi:hypothetical protein
MKGHSTRRKQRIQHEKVQVELEKERAQHKKVKSVLNKINLSVYWSIKTHRHSTPRSEDLIALT